jgi:hypothetical protein
VKRLLECRGRRNCNVEAHSRCHTRTVLALLQEARLRKLKAAPLAAALEPVRYVTINRHYLIQSICTIVSILLISALSADITEV